jgi:hypothetical protein
MEFLIGRSLANNVTNLLLDPLIKDAIQHKNLEWIDLLEQEPDAGLGNGGLGRLAACFMESAATMQLPAMGYGLRYEYGIFQQTIRDGWQQERPDNWLRRQDPWEVPRPNEKVEIGLNCSFELRGGSLCAVSVRPSNLIGIPFDRPIVGYGGRTINTLGCGLRLLPISNFRIQQRRFRRCHRDFVRGIPYPSALSRRLHEYGTGIALRAGVLPGCVLAGRCGAAFSAVQRQLEYISRKSRHSA